VEFVIEMFLNTSGVPLSNKKPRLDGGTTTTTDRFPYQVWSLSCPSVRRYG